MIKILTNPWLIAMVLGVIVFILIPFHPHKLSFKLIDQDVVPMQSNCQTYFEDLNGDGTTEQILLYNNVLGKTSMQVKGSLKGIKYQYNIEGDYYEANNYCAFGDYNNDGLKEIYVFTKRKDSVYLSWAKPYTREGNTIHHKFYFLINKKGDSYGLTAYNGVIKDINGDGSGELLCGIGTGYNLQPRVLTSYDIENDSLQVSESIGVSFFGIITKDYNNDGQLEITGSNSGSDNIKDTSQVEYKDQNAWILQYDADLNLINNPISIGKVFTNLKIINSLTDNRILGLEASILPDEEFARLFSYNFGDSDTIGIMTLPLNEKEVHFGLDTVEVKDVSYYVVANTLGEIKVFHEDLTLYKAYELGSQTKVYPLRWNSPRFEELLIWKGRRRPTVKITDIKGQLLDEIVVPKDAITQFNAYRVYKYADEPLLCLMVGSELFYYKEANNWFYLGKYLILFALVLAFFVFIKIIQKLQLLRLEQGSKIKKEMTKLQIQAIKNQLDPHFTFNALSVLNYLSHEEDTKGVEEFTKIFSSLIRKQLQMSDKASVKIFDELTFTRNYVDLQKLRFDYPIILDEEIDELIDMNFSIPKMMIHTHVDNAIKHGIGPKRGGIIHIRIYPDKQKRIIEIRDNGVGRSLNAEINRDEDSSLEEDCSTGKGLVILDQLYELYVKLYKIKIEQEIIDLQDQKGNPKGTLIRIVMQ